MAAPSMGSRSSARSRLIDTDTKHSNFSSFSIRYRGAVRTPMPEAQIRFEGYLVGETAGRTLGMPPLVT